MFCPFTCSSPWTDLDASYCQANSLRSVSELNRCFVQILFTYSNNGTSSVHYPLIFLTEQIQVTAGLDLHKSFIMATILTLSDEKLLECFDRTQTGLLYLGAGYYLIKFKLLVVSQPAITRLRFSIFSTPLCMLSGVMPGI